MNSTRAAPQAAIITVGMTGWKHEDTRRVSNQDLPTSEWRIVSSQSRDATRLGVAKASGTCAASFEHREIFRGQHRQQSCTPGSKPWNSSSSETTEIPGLAGCFKPSHPNSAIDRCFNSSPNTVTGLWLPFT
jgi:hypothetical protein